MEAIQWLHHTNVDRLLTMWQAINPTAWIQPRPNNAGTFTTRPGTVEDENSGLTPFRRTDNQMWTSKDAVRGY
jgi:tyrosinase